MKLLTGIRPSLWARCPRAAAYQGRGETEAEPPPETREYWFRGQVFEEIVVRQIIAKHGRDNVERQVVIPIDGIGEGHADFYLPADKTLGEIKSTVAPFPNSPVFEHGVKQNRIYQAFHPDAEQGVLYMLNPNRMTAADIYTVKLTDDDREEIEAERQQIVGAVGGGPLPERVCQKPGQARGRMCPFAAVCFDGYEEPGRWEIRSPDALDAAAALYALKTEIAGHNAAVKALEEDKEAAQATLSELVPEGDSTVGPFAVRRTHVRRSPSFSLKAWEAAGNSVEPLVEFMRAGAEFDTFRVAKTEAAGDIDYGEEAPF